MKRPLANAPPRANTVGAKTSKTSSSVYPRICANALVWSIPPRILYKAIAVNPHIWMDFLWDQLQKWLEKGI